MAGALDGARDRAHDGAKGGRCGRRQRQTREDDPMRQAIGRCLAAAVILGGVALSGVGSRPAAAEDVTLRVFVGGQERPDVMRPLFDQFQALHPGIKVDMEVGGATSDAQQQYLTTVLTSRDAALDVFLIDVVRPAQYAAAGWAEPLDGYLGADRQTLL